MKFKNLKGMDVYRKCSTLCFENEYGNEITNLKAINDLEITSYDYDPDTGELKVYCKGDKA